MHINRAVLFGLTALLLSPALSFAQSVTDITLGSAAAISAPSAAQGSACPTKPVIIYDTTRASTQGAEIAATANGPATCMGDKILLDVEALERQVCEVAVDVFVLASTAPFNMTMEFYTDCTTSGAAGSACGTGPGTLIPGSTATVTNITPVALGTIFTVVFPYPTPFSLSGELDDTVTVKINASRNDVFWRIGETPSVGAIPAGEPATSFVERCGSTGANNGCSRNFGVNNNFAMTISAVEGVPTSDLSVTKTDGAATEVPGTPVTYTIVATNSGPDDNPAVSFADTFAAPLTACSWTSVAAGGATGGSNSAGAAIADTLNMPNGSSVTYTATCTIAAGATGSLANTATVTSALSDPTPANNSATDTDTLTPTADLSITKDDGVASVAPGGSTTYTIAAANAGPSDVTGAAIADTFPVALTCNWTCVGAGGGTCAASGSGNVADTVNLPSGGTTTYSAICTVSTAATGSIANTATVTAPGTVTDPTPGNNSATDTDTVVLSSDLSISKTDGVTNIGPGGTLTYIITASNSGPQAATADVADTFPAECTSVGWTCAGAAGGTCTSSGTGSINDTVNLPASGSVTYTATCVTNATTPNATLISNTATVTVAGGGSDPVPGNNTAIDRTTVTALPTVAGTKTVAGAFTPGGAIVYTIVLSNTGVGAQADNPGDEFTDVLPASLTLVSATASSGTAVATVGTNTVTWNGSIAAAGTVTITINATVAAAANGLITNQGTINFDADGNGSNETTVLTDDPAIAGPANPTGFGIALTAVPSLTFWGLIALAAMMLGFAWRRRIA